VPRVLILGAASGIGRALAAEFASHGYDPILAGRDLAELQLLASDLALRYRVNAQIQSFDILDFAALESSLASCLARAGNSLEGVVLCIGCMVDHETAFADLLETRRMLDTNFTGAALTLQIMAQYFELQRKGFICALSSVAGDRGRQSNYMYGAAKSGLSTYLQGLRNRLYHAGVRVITVKPGFVDTRMTYGRPRLFMVAAPEAVARDIYNAIQKGKDVVYVPWFWQIIMLVVRAVPEGLFKKLRT
jgi:decaprenylphospho-beta-D-erythro-pentofuranosid-2-ulose 2-reductase